MIFRGVKQHAALGEMKPRCYVPCDDFYSGRACS